MRTIAVVPFNDSWPRLFDEEQRALAVMLGSDCAIHHIGSTSVPGLPAKPIIDILIEVTDVTRLDGMSNRFRALGYEPRGENGMAGRRYFVKGSAERTHQIHAFRMGSHDAVRHLACRDFLRQHDDVRDEYAEVKRRAAAECGHDIHRYVALKGDYVRSLEARSLAALSAAKVR